MVLRLLERIAIDRQQGLKEKDFSKHYHEKSTEIFIPLNGYAEMMLYLPEEERKLRLTPGGIWVFEPLEIHQFIDEYAFDHITIRYPDIPGDKVIINQ